MTERVDRQRNAIRLRAVRPADPELALWIASGMRKTLEEVLGEARGRSLYSMRWLVRRVEEHLRMDDRARVFLAESRSGERVGYAIAREERGESGGCIGLVSTVYVVPAHRRRGLACTLFDAIERWCSDRGLEHVVYATGEHHRSMRAMLESRGYALTHIEGEMVRYEKLLGGRAGG